MSYKRSTDDITMPKVDASIDVASTSVITCNGERGTLSLQLGARWDDDAAFGAGGTIDWRNTFIKANSVITLCMQNDIKCRHYHLVESAGRCFIVTVNYSGGNIADNTIIKINYRVSN